jgi:hypothetical protein
MTEAQYIEHTLTELHGLHDTNAMIVDSVMDYLGHEEIEVNHECVIRLMDDAINDLKKAKAAAEWLFENLTDKS